MARGGGCATSRPGTGTRGQKDRNNSGALLPTPHGNRNTGPQGVTGPLGTASNPSWGTGTSTTATPGDYSTSFQPLMGNGNSNTPQRSLPSSSTSNPSWGTGTGTNRQRTLWPDFTTSNPSWGTGTRRPINDRHPGSRLPTPHGEREPCTPRHLKACPTSSNPSWGTGTIG